MNILNSLLKKNHFPVMIEEVIKICNPEIGKKIFLDCTFGGGGYSKALLNFPNAQVIAIDRDKSVIQRAELLKKKFPKQFIFHNLKFSNLDTIINRNNKPDVIIFDLGLSTFQLQDLSRGFSFKAKEKIDMQMGLSSISAEEVINNFDEIELRTILRVLGEEKEASRIAKNIIKSRTKKKIQNISELVSIIERSKKKVFNKKINVCTKTFQALRIFVNKETSELIAGLIKATQLIKVGGKIIVISFHSIEDKIAKYYFTNYSSSQSNPSRYLPHTEEKKDNFFEKYKNKFLTPTHDELQKNNASRSAKLRFAIRTDEEFTYPRDFEEKFSKYLEVENYHD